jgi:SPX domain protein involved in polyphosphate accumulation
LVPHAGREVPGGSILRGSCVKNWHDDIELGWTLRDIYANRLKLSPITEDQFGELLEMGLVEVLNDQIKLTEAGYRKIR